MPRQSLLVSLLVVPLFLHLASSSAVAATWQQPTPEELKMTAEPNAPNADAIYLYREDITDNKMHSQSMYVRLKILRDEGKKYADVEIPGNNQIQITEISGRTIHSDGTVIPFTGKPYEKLLVKTATIQYKAKVFSLPDVETGSIIEYRYRLLYDDNRYVTPEWDVQEELYVRKAHYQFTPTDQEVISHTDHGSATSRIAYSHRLPSGSKVAVTRGVFTLDVSDIHGVPKEEYEPPMLAFAYRVRFYYTNMNSSEEYWNSFGKRWSHNIDKFAEPSPAISAAAKELTSGATKEDEKLARLYAAVMKLENTSFTRERSKDENRAEGVKQVKSAADVWTLRRGSSDDLAMLFLSLARAAGFHAYAMAVVNRDRDFFQQNYLNEDQLDDLVVIVVVDGKERTFDPGERYATYGELHWTHAMAGGIREQDGKTVLASTNGNGYKETVVKRIADITLAPDGAITGSATIICTGERALRWRQKALEGDEIALKKEFDETLRPALPPGLILQTDHFLGLDTPETNLMVRINISGSLGTATGKRIFLPLSIFAAGGSDPFTSSHREEPIDLRYPYLETDQVTLHLPDGMQAESVPDTAKADLPQMAVYRSAAKATGNTIVYQRNYIIANVLYKPEEYDKLKGFLDDVSNKDRAQAVVHLAAAAHTGQ